MKLFKFYIFFSIIFFSILLNNDLLSLDNERIKKIEDYLNKLNNISSNFIQINSDGLKVKGKLFLSKPGKLRIEYEKKENPLIIADGKWLHYFDMELNEIQSVTIEKSPAWILLKKKVNLKKDFKIEALNKKNNKTFITLSDKDSENIKTIKLIFLNKPLTLKGWMIIDSNEIQTTVSLLKIKKINKFNSKTFINYDKIFNPKFIFNFFS